MSSATVSKAFTRPDAYSRGMATDNRELAFNQEFTARVHELRKGREWTAEQMATALGVPADRYRKYEYRSPLPAYLMERFALIVGCDLEYLLTGRRAIRAKAAQSTDFREKRTA